MQPTNGGICRRIKGIKLDGPLGGRPGVGDGSGAVVGKAHGGVLIAGERERSKGCGKVRVKRRSAAEQAARNGIVMAVEAVHVAEARVIEAPRVKVFDRSCAGQFSLGQRDPEIKGAEHRRHDQDAYFVDVIQRAFNAFGPDHAAAAGIGQVDADK